MSFRCESAIAATMSEVIGIPDMQQGTGIPHLGINRAAQPLGAVVAIPTTTEVE